MSKAKRAVRIVMVDDDQDDLFLTGICFRQAAVQRPSSSISKITVLAGLMCYS